MSGYKRSFEASSTFSKSLSTGTGYSANDVIGTTTPSNLTFSNVLLRSVGGSVLIDYAGLIVNTSVVPTGSSGYKLKLYNSAPTAIADNAAYNLISADRSKYQGTINIGALSDYGDTCVSQNTTSLTQVKLASTATGLLGVLTTNTSQAIPASIGYKVTIRGVEI